MSRRLLNGPVVPNQAARDHVARAPGWFAALLAIVLVLTAAPLATAQGDPVEPAPTGTTGEPSSNESLAERLGLREAQLEALEDPDASDVTELAQIKQALSFLEQARSVRDSTARFQARIDNAPDAVTAIEAQLARPMRPPSLDIPEDATSEWLVDQLHAAQELAAAQRDARAEMEQQSVDRAERQSQIDADLESIRGRLEELREALIAAPDPDGDPRLATVRKDVRRCERIALDARVEMLEVERRMYVELRALFREQRQLAQRAVLEAEAAVDAWNAIVTPRLERDAVEAASEAEADAARDEDKHPAVQEIADENANLAQLAAELAPLIAAANEQIEEIDRQLSRVTTHFNSAQERVEHVGRTSDLGRVLRDLRRLLPSLKGHERSIAQRDDALSETQVKRLDADQKLFGLVDLDAKIDDLLGRHDALASEADDAAKWLDEVYLSTLLRMRLVEQRDEHLDKLIVAYDTFLERTTLLQERERELVDKVRDFASFIDARVLWVRSTEPLHQTDLGQTFDALAWLFHPASWLADFPLLRSDVEINPLTTILALCGLVLLLVIQPLSRRRLRALSPDLDEPTFESVMHLLEASMHTVLVSCVTPAAVWFVAWRLSVSAAALASAEQTQAINEGVHAAAIAAGLSMVASRLFLLELVRQICRRGGLAQSFFHWPVSNVRIIRANVTWVMLLLLPLAFILVALETAGNHAHANSLGRIAFIGAMILMSVFMLRVFRPHTGVLGTYLRHHRKGWASRLCWLWFSFVAGAPLLLAVLAGFGYYYTANQLDQRIFTSIWMVWWVLVGNSFLLRVLYLGHEAAEKKRAAAALVEATAPSPAAALKAGPIGGAPGAGESGVESPEESWEHYLADIHSHAGRLVRSAVGWSLLVGLWIIWADLLPALTRLQDVAMWTHVATDGVEESITMANVVLALVVLVATIVISMNIPGLLEISVLQHLPLDTGARYAITSIVRYLLIVVGVVLSFTAIGVGWSKVQWLIAAISVGLGFGLQEIFANFVSGLIILFEQPVRIGDCLTVDQTSGIVTRIQIRATTLRTFDRREVIIPNKQFVTGSIINWSLSSNIVRLSVAIGVEYGSDTELVKKTVLEIARKHERVLSEPAPEALFRKFGDSSLDFELRVYVPTWEARLVICDELLMRIDHAFREAGIVVAFPQTDIHVRDMADRQSEDDEDAATATAEAPDAKTTPATPGTPRDGRKTGIRTVRAEVPELPPDQAPPAGENGPPAAREPDEDAVT
ncbi:MAG: mechanosensitive ion channel [Planctomycetes bacterium]|nr:mechanosensitive ion channel [Planctomycetota bacterium]